MWREVVNVCRLANKGTAVPDAQETKEACDP